MLIFSIANWLTVFIGKICVPGLRNVSAQELVADNAHELSGINEDGEITPSSLERKRKLIIHLIYGLFFYVFVVGVLLFVFTMILAVVRPADALNGPMDWFLEIALHILGLLVGWIAALLFMQTLTYFRKVRLSRSTSNIREYKLTFLHKLAYLDILFVIPGYYMFVLLVDGWFPW